MKTIIDIIRDDDPAFDPLAQAADRAGIPLDYVRAALSRVIIDGNYGPISSAEWEEQDGRAPSDMATALDILARVSEEVEDYREMIFDEDYEGAQTEWTRAEASAIRHALFAGVVAIYGGLPW
jgi:hypothetical protein